MPNTTRPMPGRGQGAQHSAGGEHQHAVNTRKVVRRYWDNQRHDPKGQPTQRGGRQHQADRREDRGPLLDGRFLVDVSAAR
jgi:hypothetical protein